MLANLHIEALVKALRTEGTRIELDDVVFHLPGLDPIPAPFPAAVSAKGGGLRFHLRVPASTSLPDELRPLFEHESSGPVTITRRDCHRITARTEHGLAVALDGVQPRPSNSTRSGDAHRHTIGFQRIELPAEGIDAKDGDEMHRLWTEIHARHPETARPAEAPTSTPPAENIFAILPNVELLILTDATEETRLHPFHGKQPSWKANCFVGQVDGAEFCLEAGEAGDLLVHFSRPLNQPGARFDAAQLFDGILAAIGYTHGCHPWPFYREHRRDHRIIELWVKAPNDCQRHGLLPMGKGHLHQSKHAPVLFVAAVEFFAADTESAKLHTRAQWLMRNACPRHLSLDITLLTLCSLLEGIIRPLENRLLTAEEQAHPRDGGFTRPKKWRHTMERLGLPWVDAFDRVYQSWDFYRHPLAHGFHDKTRDNPGTAFNAYSRLSAALHILLAREAGYAGPIAKSILEGNEMVMIESRASE